MPWSVEQTVARAIRDAVAHAWRALARARWTDEQRATILHAAERLEVSIWALRPLEDAYGCVGSAGFSDLPGGAFEDRYLRGTGSAHYGASVDWNLSFCIPSWWESTRAVALFSDRLRGMSSRAPLFVAPLMRPDGASRSAAVYVGLSEESPGLSQANQEAASLRDSLLVAVTQSARSVAAVLQRVGLDDSERRPRTVANQGTHDPSDRLRALARAIIQGGQLGVAAVSPLVLTDGKHLQHLPPEVEPSFMTGTWVRLHQRQFVAAASLHAGSAPGANSTGSGDPRPRETVLLIKPSLDLSIEALERNPSLQMHQATSYLVQIWIAPDRHAPEEAVLSLNVGNREPDPEALRKLKEAASAYQRGLYAIGRSLQSLRSLRHRWVPCASADLGGEVVRKLSLALTDPRAAATALYGLAEFIETHAHDIPESRAISADLRTVADGDVLDALAQRARALDPVLVSGWRRAEALTLSAAPGEPDRDMVLFRDGHGPFQLVSRSRSLDTADAGYLTLALRRHAAPFARLLFDVAHRTRARVVPIEVLSTERSSGRRLMGVRSNGMVHAFGPDTGYHAFPYRSLAISWDPSWGNGGRLVALLTTAEPDDAPSRLSDSLAAIDRLAEAPLEALTMPSSANGHRDIVSVWEGREGHEVVAAYPLEGLGNHVGSAWWQTARTNALGRISAGRALLPCSIDLSDVRKHYRITQDFLELVRCVRGHAKLTDRSRDYALHLLRAHPNADLLARSTDGDLTTYVRPYVRMLLEILRPFARLPGEEGSRFGGVRVDLSPDETTGIGARAFGPFAAARHAFIGDLLDQQTGMPLGIVAIASAPVGNVIDAAGVRGTHDPFSRDTPLARWIANCVSDLGMTMYDAARGDRKQAMPQHVRDALSSWLSERPKHLGVGVCIESVLASEFSDLRGAPIAPDSPAAFAVLCPLTGPRHPPGSCRPYPDWWVVSSQAPSLLPLRLKLVCWAFGLNRLAFVDSDFASRAARHGSNPAPLISDHDKADVLREARQRGELPPFLARVWDVEGTLKPVQAHLRHFLLNDLAAALGVTSTAGRGKNDAATWLRKIQQAALGSHAESLKTVLTAVKKDPQFAKIPGLTQAELRLEPSLAFGAREETRE